MIKRFSALGLLLSGAAVFAAPAPVTDLNDNSMEQRLAVLERIVDSRTDMQLRIQQQLDNMQQEVSELRGTLELHNHQLEQILERQRELYLEIDRRIEQVSSQTASTPALGGASTAVTPVTPDAANVAVLGESEAYDKAVNLVIRDKRYEDAIPEFRNFLQNYPNSSFTPNAHYWLGQLLFNNQDWSGAAEQFQILVSGYPDSNKRADAMFKLGVVEQKRENLARAKQLFEDVISAYPDSSSSKLAESRLKTLN